MGIILAGVFMMGMTAGCGGNADSKTAEETEAPAAAEETEEAKQEKLPFEIYKSNQLEGTAEFQLADISFHPQVKPSKPVAYGHVMTVSDESKSYLDVAACNLQQ